MWRPSGLKRICFTAPSSDGIGICDCVQCLLLSFTHTHKAPERNPVINDSPHGLNLILDVTHLSDTSFWETMEIYNGNLWASHNNCRKFVNHNRQFSDDQIKEIIRRDGVIGVPLDAWMMVPNWIRGESTPEKMGVTLNQMIDNIDHICQLSGNSSHVGIGSDLDGAFGKEQTPYDLDTIADLQKIPVMLSKRGYSELDIEKIMSLNFVEFLKRVWE